MSRFFLVLAAVNGFVVVGLGAFGAHGLENLLTPQALATWDTAVRYHMFHAGGLALAGLVASLQAPSGALRWSGHLLQAGIFLFSGSLYLLALSGLRWLGMVTPLGGVAFLAAWALLAVHLLRQSPTGWK